MQIEEGGVYATRASWLRWSFLRVLKLNDEVAHLRFYKRKFWRRPTLKQFDKNDWFLGHTPVVRETAERWESEYVGTLPVEEDELVGYRIWAESDGAGVFK